MQDLPPIDQREWRARAFRSAMIKRALIAARRSAQCGVTIVAALLVAVLIVPPSPPEPEVIAPGGAGSQAPALRPPQFVAIMSGEGATSSFARSSLKLLSKVTAVPDLLEVLQDTWLSAFYGDKQRLREFIEHTATASGLPSDFLLRLLQQESGLDHRAVSRAGAQGVAQFMPATAAERGLVDPFDPFEAIPKAADFLREQRAVFGSLGLAAAAYNAGPQRVRNWLAGRSSLPLETRTYVAKVTGRSVDEWRQGGDLLALADPEGRTSWLP